MINIDRLNFNTHTFPQSGAKGVFLDCFPLAL